VAVTGANQPGNYVVAQKLASEMRHIPGAVDVHVQQAFDAPTLFMDIDRTRVQSVGMQARDVAQNVLVSLSSSFQTAPTFWLDPQNGINYNIAVQTPQYRIDSYQALQTLRSTAAFLAQLRKFCKILSPPPPPLGPLPSPTTTLSP